MSDRDGVRSAVTASWHREVPGARWFKADLHVHASGHAIGVCARRVLQGAARRQVRVIGITARSPRSCTGDHANAAWRMVEEWNDGIDDDGTPFRHKIYALFPGFEAALHDGTAGLRLVFLFDPGIGRKNYLEAFDLMMELRPSDKSADDALHDLRAFHRRKGRCVGPVGWNYLVLAPRGDDDGLPGAQAARIMRRFPHGEIAGIELTDRELPEDAESHQAFFHGSGARSADAIGTRHTWFKLASPRIEALRQAFVACESRIRLAYERGATGGLVAAPTPDVTMNERPWLRSITVTGRASFFGVDDGAGPARFDFSPDLTCIIGGSMTGKSTLLDGLRVYVEAPLPQDDAIRKQVEARGRERFLAGSPEVVLECPGRDPTAPPHERWPARFFAQNELQRLATDPEAIEDILEQLTPEQAAVAERKNRLRALDHELASAVRWLAKLDQDVAEAEQACERCRKAAADFEVFADAGIRDLHRASRDCREWQDALQASRELHESMSRVLESSESLHVADLSDDGARVLQEAGIGETSDDGHARRQRIGAHLRAAVAELANARAVIGSAAAALKRHERAVKVEVERNLADHGLDAAKIRGFQTLSAHAALLPSYEAALRQKLDARASAERLFRTRAADRRRLVGQVRAAFDRVIGTVGSEFEGRILARRIDHGDRTPLDRFLRGLRQRGVTRWWNDLPDDERPAPEDLLEALRANRLTAVGMSTAVQQTFRDSMSRSQQWELAAIRCPDRYVIALGMDDDSHRRLEDLSGGQRVSVLLSLLLEARDDRPLVIDQPEDELDNRFLFDTVLPALKRLKGRRQVVVATHDANIVVNGDADQVIRLEATADHGRVAQTGAIEDPAVRDAIVGAVDGGADAFRLRRLKYGF